MKTIDTLIHDVFDLFDDTKHHEPSEENLNALGQGVVDIVRRRLAERSEGGGVLRFSSLGRPDRQLWYMQNNPSEKETMSGKTMFKFLFGDLIEQMMLFLVKEAGHTVEFEQGEVEVDGVKGHLDAIIDGVTVDVKSASPYGFNKFKDGSLKENDPFGYMQQISGYAEQVTPETGAAFLAVDKVAGGLAILKVDPDTVRSFDTSTRINHLKSVLSSEEVPPHCYSPIPEGKSGNMKLPVNCSYCSFRFKCWEESNGGKGLRTFVSSKGPVYFTHIEKEPRMFEQIG